MSKPATAPTAPVGMGTARTPLAAAASAPAARPEGAPLGTAREAAPAGCAAGTAGGERQQRTPAAPVPPVTRAPVRSTTLVLPDPIGYRAAVGGILTQAERAKQVAVAAAREGATALSKPVKAALDRRVEAAKLARLLPEAAVARTLGLTAPALRARPAATSAGDIVSMLVPWGVTSLSRATSTYARFIVWLREERNMTHADEVPGCDSNAFVVWVGRTAKDAAATRKSGRTEPNPRADKRDGSTAEQTAREGLEFMEKNLSIRLGTTTRVFTAGKAAFTQGRPPEPSESLSVRMMAGLERLAEDTNASEFVRAQSGAFVFMGLGTLRLAQANDCARDLGAQQGFVRCVTGQTKHPNHKKQAPGLFFVPKRGVTGSEGWLQAMTDGLAGVEDECFVLRDTDSKDGNPTTATKWQALPCTGTRAEAALQGVLQAAGFDPGDVGDVTYSSFRHFLPNAAAARGEPPEVRNELGVWAGSVAATLEPTPTELERVLKKTRADFAKRVRKMPTLYAGAARPTYVCDIIERQVAACRALASGGVDKLPVRGGWSLLSPTAKAPPALPAPPSPSPPLARRSGRILGKRTAGGRA